MRRARATIFTLRRSLCCHFTIISYLCGGMRDLILLIFALCATIVARADGHGFNLIVVGDPQPQTEEQLSRLEQDIIPKIGQIVEHYKTTGYPTAILLTGDVVWDTMAFLPRVKSAFEELGVEVYAVIGNHDHNRAIEHNESLAEREFIETFGTKQRSFTMGDTRFILADNILFDTYSEYSIGISDTELDWITSEIEQCPDNQRIAICMHAPASDLRTGKPLGYAKPLIRSSRRHKLHFITGHCHRHNTVEINRHTIEHSVAQVNGNLWFAPLCADGTPQGVLCIEERDGEWRWRHQTLDTKRYMPLVVYQEGEVDGHEEEIVVKIIGWDKRWRIEWVENNENRGAMKQIDILDPSYLKYVNEEADYNDVIMQRLRRSARPAKHYFRCRRTTENSQISIIATDRFGREYRVDL